MLANLYLFILKDYEKALSHSKLGIKFIDEVSGLIKEFYLSKFLEMIVEIYEMKDEIDLSLEYLSKVFEYNRNSEPKKKAELNKKYGDLLFKKGNYDYAIKAYLNSIDLNENQDEVYADLARVYILKEEYENAKKILDKAVLKNTDFKVFYYLQGLIYKYVDKNENLAFEKFQIFEKNNSFLEGYNSLIQSNKNIFPSGGKLESIRLLNKIEEFLLEHPFYFQAYLDYIEFCKRFNLKQEESESFKKQLITFYPFTRNFFR